MMTNCTSTDVTLQAHGALELRRGYSTAPTDTQIIEEMLQSTTPQPKHNK